MVERGRTNGFTIVELLIVIVIIAILATVTIVAYNGINTRAQDSKRSSDINSITKAIELYYIENGQFPTSNGSTTINGSWSTSADASWQHLQAQLSPKYLSVLPSDPINQTGTSVIDGGYSYAYYASNWINCGSAPGQMYILIYRMSSTQVDTFEGPCLTDPLYYPGLSNWRVAR